MKTVPPKQSSWPAIARRFVLPGLIALLLLAAPKPGASSPILEVAHPPGPWRKHRETRLALGAGQCPMPPAAGLGFLLTNQSAQVSGDLAHAWVYGYRSLAGIYPGGWGRTLANAKGFPSFAIPANGPCQSF